MKSEMLAAKNPDWMQVVYNQGPPCFHAEDGRFCLRAERWDGHKDIGGSKPIHDFVSLEDLLKVTRAQGLRDAAEICARERETFKTENLLRASVACSCCETLILEAADKLQPGEKE